MWLQTYSPVAGNLALSAVAAAVPLFVLVYFLGVRRSPSWIAALSGLGAAGVVAVAVYRMPPALALGASAFGAAFGLFPIVWIVFWSIFLYRLTVETGRFEVIKDSIGGVTQDRRLQALLIAFAFGAFVEGAAGFGAPVAVAAAMLSGLGFSPFAAAGICLLANTAPVAFGSIGTPIITLAGITGLPMAQLSAAVGRICAPVSVLLPAYLVLVIGGLRGLAGVLPAALVCGAAFASVQLAVSNLLGPELTDILASIAAMAAMLGLLALWRPRDAFSYAGARDEVTMPPRHPIRRILSAWFPYGVLVVSVLLWGHPAVKAVLHAPTFVFEWPGLHELVQQAPPAVTELRQYPARFTFNWLSAPGTGCMIAGLLSGVLLRVPARTMWVVLKTTAKQMAKPALTVASVLALAFLMNYSGATATLGLAFAATGTVFPFFSAILGWLGVFLTGSDTSANALFGNLQVVTASRLDLNPVLMAASNSSGGVMGKMISLQSIAVGAAATGMTADDESRLFRFTLKHSILLASLIGLIVTLYAYVVPAWVPAL